MNELLGASSHDIKCELRYSYNVKFCTLEGDINMNIDALIWAIEDYKRDVRPINMALSDPQTPEKRSQLEHPKTGRTEKGRVCFQ